MALIKCPECGKEFSDRAAACPNCGCPVEAISENEKEEISGTPRTIDTVVGELTAYDTYVRIVSKNIFNLTRQPRNIYYRNISAITYCEPSFFMNGYIQFIISGTNPIAYSVTDKNLMKKIAMDENTIGVGATRNKKRKKEYSDFIEYLNSKIR